MLDYCLADAKARGFKAIEAYPQTGGKIESHKYHGFLPM